MTAEDHLWDPETTTPDDDQEAEAKAEVQCLEERLAGMRYEPRRFDVREADARDGEAARDGGAPWQEGRRSVFDARSGRVVRIGSILAAAAAVLLMLLDTFGGGETEDAPAGPAGRYQVEALEGDPRIERGGASGPAGSLRPGDRVVCDDGTRAELLVAGAGNVRLEPNTELRVEGTDGSEGWRLFLERGQLTASIFAAPRLFQVGTPSGIAVDLGCFYTARVDAAGETTLTVRGGQVSFESVERKVFVPAGARIVARPGRGPGTPVWEDSSVTLRRAVDLLDAWPSRGGVVGLDDAERAALDLVVQQTDVRHSLTLWHLLDHAHPDVRDKVMGTLASRSPPPDGVTLEGVVDGDHIMLGLWRESLDDDW